MRKPHQVAVGAWRVDDDEIEAALDRAHRGDELLEFGVLVLGDQHRLAGLDAVMHGQFECKTGAPRPGAPVADVTRETLLAAVEIDGGDPLAGLHQRNGNVQGGGGFARTALLVTQHHHVGRAGLTLTSLLQHASTPSVLSDRAHPWSSKMHRALR